MRHVESFAREHFEVAKCYKTKDEGLKDIIKTRILVLSHNTFSYGEKWAVNAFLSCVRH